MDIKQLKYFLATVDHGNMTRAADSLHIAQPALSQQIAGLERDLGSKLLERSVRGVRPTVAGEVLYRHAKGLLRHVEDLKGAVSFERQHPSGRVSVGLSGGVARMLLVPLLDALRDYPDILLEVIVRQSSELAGLVAQGSLDMAIAIDALPQRGIAIQPLFREELYVALPRSASLRRTSGISLEELAKLPLLLPSAPNATRTRLDLAFLNANLNYSLVAEISAPDLLIRLIEEGEACSVLPWSAIHREVAEDRLQAVPLLPDTIAREVSLCESEDVPPGEAALVVRRIVLELLESLQRSGDWKGCEKIAAARR